MDVLKRKFGHRDGEERLYEDIQRRWTSVSQGKRPQGKPPD